MEVLTVDDRERLIQIIQEAVGGCARHWAALIADNLIAHGVGIIKQTPIETLELSLRAYHSLKRAGINTVEELRVWDEGRIARLYGVGETILKEILSKRNGGTEE